MRFLIASAIAFAVALIDLQAVTLGDLMSDPKLTPKRFANYFANFDFQLFPYVQTAEQFLSSQRGDCQDYAILADYVLSRKGYETRLIRVVMVGAMPHDVCYVTQTKSYLDYNNRVYFINLQRSDRRIREIATRVADSFSANWTSASVYTYNYKEDIKHMKLTVVKTDPPDEDPDAGNGS